MNIEVVVSDSIGSKYVEIEATDLTEAAIRAATNYVLEAVREGDSFDGYQITLETLSIARLNFVVANSEPGEAVYFDAIENPPIPDECAVGVFNRGMVEKYGCR